ncbi:MAG: hypothetical protein OQK97_02575 [Deltaproteobacteria bacterium]|jgi:hypothetical protein|nr:hypothetical protein [Deltaproteobacteria bacterium]
MKQQTFILVLMAMLMIPASAMAMKGMDHSKMKQADGMSMGGEMIMLEDTEVEGIMASGHMMDIRIKMAEHGMSQTHHFMVGFMNEAKKMVSDGQVALKIEAPDGKVSPAIKLMGMSGQFGADITLDQQGMYRFKIGTKFADGNSRVFHMHYDNS